MNRFYYDSYLHRYTEAQLENNQLRREILDLKEQVQNLKWFNGDLKSENSRDKIRIAEQSRYLSSKLTDLELTVSDLRHDNYLVKKEAGLKVKQLNEEKNLAKERAERLEWLNSELKREKDRHARLASEYEYQSLKKSNEVSQVRRELDQERRRVESLDRLNSSLNSDYFRKSLEVKDMQKKLSNVELDNTLLSSELRHKRAELKESGDRIERLREDRDRLLSDVSMTREELERTRSRLNSTELSKSILETSLKREKEEKETLKQNSFDLTMENLEIERRNAEYEKKLKNHEKMFQQVYDESRYQLEKIVRLAEKNLDISRQDASLIQGGNDNASELDLNTSNAFTKYHEQQQQQPKKVIHDDIDRDLRMYRMENALNDSLERLKKWKNGL